MGKDQRLKSRKLIERIFREGKSIYVFPYRVYYVLEDSARSGESVAGKPGRGKPSSVVQAIKPGHVRRPLGVQAGFGVSSRHFKKAVDRNRIKRQTREAYRLNKGALEQMVEERKQSLCLFFTYTGKELPEHRLVSGKIVVALEKICKEIGS